MPELVYKRAGHIELYRYRDGKRFLFNGVVESIEPSITRNTVQVADGNSDFDHTFSNGVTGQVKVNFNSFVPSFYAALVSADLETNKSSTVRRIEQITVPEVSPYTVTLKGTPVDGSVVVVDENNEELTKVQTSPAKAGEYSVNTNALTFSSEDAGKNFVVAYDENTTVTNMTLPAESNNEVFRLTIVGEAVLRSNEGVKKVDNLIIDRATVAGEIPMPSRQKEPKGWSVTFNVLPPRPGFKPVDYRVEE